MFSSSSLNLRVRKTRLHDYTLRDVLILLITLLNDITFFEWLKTNGKYNDFQNRKNLSWFKFTCLCVLFKGYFCLPNSNNLL